MRPNRDDPNAEAAAASVATHLQTLVYPLRREELVEAAADNGAPAELINFLKCLPSAAYASYTDVQRDFAEASKRFGLGADGPAWREHGDRSNIGRDAIERPEAGHTRHP